ncbi:hypothetical protein PFISCL1PPCAC_6337, partial [Pristionchus fissidentatus]
ALVTSLLEMVAPSSVPSIWEGNGAQIYYIPYQFGSIIGPEKLWNDLKAHRFFTDFWSCSIWIAIFYSLGVHIVQRAMANRKAWDLKQPLILWNAALSVFSLMGTIRMGEEFFYVIRSRPLLDSISYAVDPHSPAAFWACCFAVSKVFELGDTVFVLLRKKPLIFLHWYHHAVVLVYVCHSASELVAGGRWFIFMNYGVHTIMYAYYAITAAGIRLPRILSMIITTLQTSQMLVGVAISFIVLYYKLQGKIMQQSMENLSICFAIYASFAVLFMNFFHKAYLTKKEKKTKTQ